MTKKKTTYLSPETELLVVRFEENIMSVKNGVNYATTPGGAGGDDEIENGGSF